MAQKDKAAYRAYQRLWRERNKKRLQEYQREWYARNKETQRPLQRASHMLRTYGLTKEQYDLIFVAQKKCCAICATKQPGGSKHQWHVDHDHRTGTVRGILCFRCNVGLGSFGDNIKRLRKAVTYLTKPIKLY